MKVTSKIIAQQQITVFTLTTCRSFSLNKPHTVRVNMSIPSSGSIAIYGRHILAPTPTQYDFVRIVHGQRLHQYYVQETSRRRKRDASDMLLKVRKAADKLHEKRVVVFVTSLFTGFFLPTTQQSLFKVKQMFSKYHKFILFITTVSESYRSLVNTARLLHSTVLLYCISQNRII